MTDSLALSVVIPVHDEEDSLDALHRELDAALHSVRGGCEIVFVDDGSRDRSLALLREIERKDARVRVLALDGCHGQSAALAAGFQAARGSFIATLDADLQNDPADLPRLLAELSHADVVNGVRAERRDDWVRRLSSRVANAVRRAVVHDGVSDVGCSLRVMRADCLRRVRPFHGFHRFLPALLQLEGARVVEVPVSHRPRRYGRSKYGIRNRLLPGLVDLFGVRWLQSRALRVRVKEWPGGERPPEV
ncbi:MAG: glycosyltransferase [Proteobacteria bacterium]|nr:glycosyltransferase [Pseudomonadota bacterium]